MHEILGYVASALVAVSMVFSSNRLLRIVNTVGAGLFIVYAALLPSMPVLLTNAFVLVVDIIHLVREFRKRKIPTPPAAL